MACVFFPHAHDDFVGWIPPPEANDVLASYEKRLFGDDTRGRMDAARRWFDYAENCSLLRYDPQVAEQAGKNEPVVYGTGRLNAFYFRNRMFLDDGQLLRDIDRISHLPAMIVQGGHDVIAPPQAACRLHRAWPGSILRIVPDAGHSPSEIGI